MAISVNSLLIICLVPQQRLQATIKNQSMLQAKSYSAPLHRVPTLPYLAWRPARIRSLAATPRHQASIASIHCKHASIPNGRMWDNKQQIPVALYVSTGIPWDTHAGPRHHRGPSSCIRCYLVLLDVERYQVDVGFVRDAAQLGMYATVHSNGDFARLLQVSLSRRGLGLTTQGLFLRREREENVSRRERSFLLSVDPTKVGEFLGLPPDAFDGHTSLSLSRAFDLIISNRFFDASAVTAWSQTGYTSTSSKRRPMIENFCEWWHSTGKSSLGNQTCDCGNEEAWVDFFGERERYLEWKGKGTEKEKEVEMRKECKKLLNFGMIQTWFPEFPNGLVGEVLRKVRGER